MPLHRYHIIYVQLYREQEKRREETRTKEKEEEEQERRKEKSKKNRSRDRRDSGLVGGGSCRKITKWETI